LPSRTLLRYHLELTGRFRIHSLPAKEHLCKGVVEEAAAAPVLKVTAGEVAAASNVMSKEVNGGEVVAALNLMTNEVMKEVPASMTSKKVTKEVPASVAGKEVTKEGTVVPDSKVTK
jgi:hypothetical protein